MPTCTECGVELEYDDTLDIDVYDGDVRSVNVGHCPECGQTYQWTEVYEFDRFENLEPCED